jgi:hypothetical protein
MSTQKQGTKTVADLLQLVDDFHTLLGELGVNNAKNGLQVIQTLRDNVSVLHEQNVALISALECNNWKNALRRAESLVGKSASQIDPPTHGEPLVGGGSGVKNRRQD